MDAKRLLTGFLNAVGYVFIFLGVRHYAANLVDNYPVVFLVVGVVLALFGKDIAKKILGEQ